MKLKTRIEKAYEPYKVDSLVELMKHAHNIGWFSGTHKVFEITCSSGFEAFSGRASETWECQYIVKLNEIKNSTGTVINPAGEFRGRLLEEACYQALIAIKKVKEDEWKDE